MFKSGQYNYIDTTETGASSDSLSDIYNKRPDKYLIIYSAFTELSNWHAPLVSHSCNKLQVRNCKKWSTQLSNCKCLQERCLRLNAVFFFSSHFKRWSINSCMILFSTCSKIWYCTDKYFCKYASKLLAIYYYYTIYVSQK